MSGATPVVASRHRFILSGCVRLTRISVGGDHEASGAIDDLPVISLRGRQAFSKAPQLEHVAHQIPRHESGNGGAKDSIRPRLQISTPSARSRWKTGYRFAEIPHRRFCSWMFLASAHRLHRLFEAENEPELLATETVKEPTTRQEKSSYFAADRLEANRDLGVPNAKC
jgi:hypothetical protein